MNARPRGRTRYLPETREYVPDYDLRIPTEAERIAHALEAQHGVRLICWETAAEQALEECLDDVDGRWEDHGIGPTEAWGVVQNHEAWCFVVEGESGEFDITVTTMQTFDGSESAAATSARGDGGEGEVTGEAAVTAWTTSVSHYRLTMYDGTRKTVQVFTIEATFTWETT